MTCKATNASSQYADLWNARYRNDCPAGMDIGNKVTDAILSHRSVRAFLPEPLPEGALELGIAAAQSAPTSSNLQAWSVVAVTDFEVKQRISLMSNKQKHIERAPVLLVFLADLYKLRESARLNDMPSDGLDYLESFLVAVIDAAIAAQNAIIAFESIGLGTCYIGAIRNHADKVAAELDLPEEVFPVVGMTVGVPDPEHTTGIKPRLPQHLLLHSNRYRKPKHEDLLEYNRTLQGFQAEQNMPRIDWTTQVSNRIRDAEALTNRHHLRKFITDMGFKLK